MAFTGQAWWIMALIASILLGICALMAGLTLAVCGLDVVRLHTVMESGTEQQRQVVPREWLMLY